MVLTPSDIGDTPAQVEMNLTRMFKRAKSWDAVLLIDEADVFMERRVASDLARNSLVAGKLTTHLSGMHVLTQVQRSCEASRTTTGFCSSRQTG